MQVPPRFIRWADLYVVKFALPVLVLSKISRMKIDGAMLVPVAIAWAVMMSCAVVIVLLSRRRHWDASITGALLMVGVLGNTSFLGLGLVEGILGTDHMPAAVAYDQLGTFVCLTIYGSFIVSRYGAGDFSFASITHRLIRFMPFLALLASFPARYAHISDDLDHVFDLIGRTVGPVAMGALGLRFTLRVHREVLQPAVSGLVIKMLALPGVLIALAFITGHIHAVTWQSSILEASMPPMVTAGVVAVGAGLNEDVVAFMVGIGTLCGFLTVPLVSLLL